MPATAEYIKKLAEDRKGSFGDLHKQIRGNRDLRFRRHPVHVPDAYVQSTTVIRSPIIEDILLRVVGTLTTDDPVISVPPYSATDKSKRNASLRERWSQAALWAMMDAINRPVLRMGIDAAVSDGLGVWKLIERKDAWKGFPKRRQDEQIDNSLSIDENEKRVKKYLDRTEKFGKGQVFPYLWTDVESTNYYPVNHGYGSTEVLEISVRPLIPAMQTFGVFKNASGKYQKLQPGEAMPHSEGGGSDTVECIEHWDSDYVTYMLGEEIVDQRKVDYGRPPYFEIPGHMTSSRKPDEQYRSVIQPFANLVPGLDAMLTMMTNLGYVGAYPWLVKDNPDAGIAAGPANPTEVTELHPGMVLQNVKFLEVPGAGRALVEMVQQINLMIDRSGLAAVMYGQGASSSSGYMVSQLMTAAQLVYAPIVDNARMALQQMIPFVWRLIEKRAKSKVYVHGETGSKGEADWLGLGQDDIDGYYACKVELKPLLPMDEIAQGDFAERMATKKIWSKEHSRIHTGVEQPEEEADQIAVEEYMESPRINELIIEDAARRAGLIKEPPPSVPPPPPAGPTILGPDGMPIGAGGGMPPIGPIQPMVPGVNMPLPAPAGPTMPGPVGPMGPQGILGA